MPLVLAAYLSSYIRSIASDNKDYVKYASPRTHRNPQAAPLAQGAVACAGPLLPSGEHARAIRRTGRRVPPGAQVTLIDGCACVATP